jgi:hypothetical protein
MRNTLIIVLCCVTLLAVAIDMTVLRPLKVRADTVSAHIIPVPIDSSGRIGAQYFGETIIGFSCVSGNPTVCFLATR